MLLGSNFHGISSLDLCLNKFFGSLLEMLSKQPTNKTIKFFEAINTLNNQLSGNIPEFIGGLNSEQKPSMDIREWTHSNN